MQTNKSNNLFIISGPSGAGEDSIIEGLKSHFPIERVITTTSRPMRPGDSNGNPYYFISKEEFKKRIEEEKFFEWAQEYNDNYYGVTHEEINRVIDSNKIGIWKIVKNLFTNQIEFGLDIGNQPNDSRTMVTM